MATNNKTSLTVNSQLPAFVREDYETFAMFLQAYYQFMEQDGNVIDRAQNFESYHDIDETVDDFIGHLYQMYLSEFPNDTVADKKLILKHSKDFYRARGTEKSIQFLLNVVFGEQSDVYYPKTDILRTSDGKWYVQQTLRLTNLVVDGVSNSDFSILNQYVSRRIYGNTSNATAVVESANRFNLYDVEIDELTLSHIVGVFLNNEDIKTQYVENGVLHDLRSGVYGGQVTEISIITAGTNYKVGDPVTIVPTTTGNGAIAYVSAVSTGNIAEIKIVSGGAGYHANDRLLFSGGGGYGANAIVGLVNATGNVHSNSYIIYNSQIGLEANTQLGNSVYTNLASSNVNTEFEIAWVSFIYSNTGPIEQVVVINSGENYKQPPDITVSANTLVRGLGILGTMEILDGGRLYSNDDVLIFNNVPGGDGINAQGGIIVDGNGTIQNTYFVIVEGFPAGGVGYSQDFLPSVEIKSNTGIGGNVIVTNLLTYGAQLVPVDTPIGEINDITLVTGGQNYGTPPTIDLSQYGDGTATANARVVQGVIVHPGRYLNDDGFVSSYNFLQNRDYYQNFSYVVSIKESLDNYRKMLKDLINPAGMKLFGRYNFLDETDKTANGTAITYQASYNPNNISNSEPIFTIAV